MGRCGGDQVNSSTWIYDNRASLRACQAPILSLCWDDTRVVTMLVDPFDAELAIYAESFLGAGAVAAADKEKRLRKTKGRDMSTTGIVFAIEEIMGPCLEILNSHLSIQSDP